MQAGLHHSILLSQKQCFFFLPPKLFSYVGKRKTPKFCLFKRLLPFTNEAESKMEAYEEEKKPLILTHCNHLFWQKQAVEVVDTLFKLWKQTSPGRKTA